MTQQDWLLLAFKVATIAAFLSLVGWIAIYTRLYPWWRDAIGQTLVIKTGLVALLLVPTTLSLFFDLNRFTSYMVGWIDAVLIGLICPVMVWRSVVWIRIHREEKETP